MGKYCASHARMEDITKLKASLLVNNKVSAKPLKDGLTGRQVFFIIMRYA
jgi:hypothetical protein